MQSAGTDVWPDLAPPIPPKDLFQQFLLAGGFGGIVRTTTAPLERLRYRPKNNRAINVQLSRILSKEGLSGLWAGNFTNCLRVFRLQVYLVFFHCRSLPCIMY